MDKLVDGVKFFFLTRVRFPPSPFDSNFKILKRPRINNQIRAAELRVIDEEGKSLGVFDVVTALAAAKEKGLDLIEISPTANPPVAKIMDFGKFLYKEKRKARGGGGGHETETKNIRLRLGTSEHDLALKAKKASEFLKENNRLRLELFLRGREKYLNKPFLKERLYRILNLISENYKIVEDVKGGPRSICMVIEKSH